VPVSRSQLRFACLAFCLRYADLVARTALDDPELVTDDPDRLLGWVSRSLGERGARLARHFREALEHPSRSAVARYVDDYRRAMQKAFEAAVTGTKKPSAGREVLHADVRIIAIIADLGAAEAPLSPWVAAYGPDGVLLDVFDRLRRQQPDLRQFELPRPRRRSEAAAEFQNEVAIRFFHATVRAIAERENELPLRQVQRALNLSVTDLGRLFGVSRQAAAQWIESGTVPADRQEKLAALAAVVDLLERKLKPGRLPGVARTPASDWDDLTLLEMVEQDRHRELLERVRASFDWSAAA
jgi:transcriptional regulator with XRE-family HTH domain